VAVSCAVPATTGIASSYDVDSGVELRRSDKYITVTVNISPPDFHFYRVDADGKAVFTTESPYHGDFAITNTFAFRGRPATHLVTHEGRFLKLDGCLTATSSYPPSGACLVKDGVLGTPQTSQSFFAMETGGDGYLYAIAGTYGGYGTTPCTSGCSVQKIDLEQRIIVSQAALPSTGIAQGFRLRHDGFTGRAIVGGSSSCSTSYPYTCSGWRLWAAAY
jgi:hypothetical protein